MQVTIINRGTDGKVLKKNVFNEIEKFAKYLDLQLFRQKCQYF